MFRQGGLTLTELLVTLAVIAVLVGVVFPGFQGLVQRNELVTVANDFVLSVQYARSEASKRGRAVFICPLDASDAANEWGLGWQVVLRDAGEDCSDTIADADVIREFGPIDDALTLDSPADTTELSFDARGMLTASAAEALEACLPGVDGTQITIAPTGRPSTDDFGGC